MKPIKNIILLVLFGSLLSDCKKGENDPAFTLRSRKARLVGHWTIDKGTCAYQGSGDNVTPYHATYSLNGSNVTLHETKAYQSTPVYYTGSYLLTIDFTKDGKFELNETLAGNVLKASGTWDFGSGVGEMKKKEELVLKITEVSQGETDRGHLINKLTTEFSYRIVGLHKDKLELSAFSPVYINGKGGQWTVNADYTLKR